MKTITFLFLFIFMTTQIISGQTPPPPLEAGVSQSLAKWRAANYSDVRYKLNITLEKMAPLMKGEIEIRVNLTETGAKNDLVLDWRATPFASDKNKPFAEVVAVNESLIKKLPDSGNFAYVIDKEHIVIAQRLLKTSENVIRIKFASPVKTSGAAVTRYVDKEDGAEYIYSLFVPSDASTAFPVFDQPDLKARFTLNVLAPREWKVISNSKSEEFRVKDIINNPRSYEDRREFDQKKSWAIFLETKPISTYVFAFAAGEFAEVSEPSAVADGLTRAANNSKTNENASKNSIAPKAKLKPPADAGGSDLSSKIYVRKSQADKFKAHEKEVFRLNREGVKFLEEWFDYKFPFPKYDLVLIPEFPFGGMEHAGETFLREDRIIFPTEPTKNDFITRANLIFHEAAHQWFGDTVTMKWFDDLWLKEGFAEFMAYKTLEKVMPEYNAWKIFYERNKQAAYLTDITRGTTPIYQEISNLSAAKSAYGNIVYRKAPSFLKQAEFYLGEKDFQRAVRVFLKKYEFKNAEWSDLVNEFQIANITIGGGIGKPSLGTKNVRKWAETWVKQRGLPVFKMKIENPTRFGELTGIPAKIKLRFSQSDVLNSDTIWSQKLKFYYIYENGRTRTETILLGKNDKEIEELWGINFLGREAKESRKNLKPPKFIFTNYQDYGYGIFLLDEKSRAFILENIQSEKDDFLRSMMWGSLWDSVRFYELAPEDYVKLVIKNINVEQDESTISALLGRASTAMNYYLSDKEIETFAPQFENLLLEKMRNASTPGQKITYYRAFLNIASSEKARNLLKNLLKPKTKDQRPLFELKTKDKFDLVTRLIILGDPEGLKLLAELEKTERDDAAKRYAYAARAGIATADNKAKFWRDFTENKEIPENWIESAFAVWNSPKHADLTLPYLEKALMELPNLKKNRKIFFVNGWLSSFIGGQKSAEALKIVNDFLEKNPNLDRDLRLKILENVDGLERAVKIREGK